MRNPNMTSVKVRIDVANNLISVWINGEQHFHVPELIFEKTVTGNNYDEWVGANLVNIYLSEFTIETADGKRKNMRYKQVFTNNTGKKSEIAKCHRGCLGKGVKVELDGKRVPAKMFEDYVKLYLPTSMRIFEKINNRWEVCVCLADGLFEQVSFVNNIATMKGGSHVDYITNQITSYLASIVDFEPNDIKSYLWVFPKPHHILSF
ncbi:DNA topoisomerase 2-like protein [Tanacetum coccineum]